jgi:hypothetical protein
MTYLRRFYGPDSTVAKEPKTNKGLEVVNWFTVISWRLSQGKPARHLMQKYLEIRDTWSRFSSLETSKQRWIT